MPKSLLADHQLREGVDYETLRKEAEEAGLPNSYIEDVLHKASLLAYAHDNVNGHSESRKEEVREEKIREDALDAGRKRIDEAKLEYLSKQEQKEKGKGNGKGTDR